MSIVNVYERAYARHEMEKEAEAVVDAYGTADGYLPEAYFGAFLEMEKEAHAEMLVSAFAPETGYIPARYVGALEKEAQILAQFGNALKNTAKNVMSKVSPGATQQLGNIETKTMYKGLTDKATLGDMGKYYGAKALGVMSKNPGATLAGAGVLGTGAAYGGYRMMGGGQK